MARIALIAAALAALSGCSDDLTEIMVVTDSDIPASRLDGVRFVVEGNGVSQRRDTLFSVQRPATLGIVRRDDGVDEIHVTAIGMLGGSPLEGPQEIRRSARVRFVEGEVRVLALHLAEACVGFSCMAAQTCAATADGPRCRDERVEPDELGTWDGTPDRFDAGPRPPTDGGNGDGGPGDGGIDAGSCTSTEDVETTCDGMDNDCDGTVDEGFDLAADPLNCGSCNTDCGSVDCVQGLCADATTAVAAGEQHTCATNPVGAAYCWGKGGEGRLGTGDTASSPAPVPVTGLPASVTRLGAGERFGCALLANQEVWCWGDDGVGQLGNGAGTGPGPTRVEITSGTPLLAVDLAVGFEHACAIGAGGGVWCWGGNDMGQLGDGSTTLRQAPVSVIDETSAALSDATSVAVGLDHSCAATGDGMVHCWGSNSDWQLGSTITGSVSSARDVVGVSGAVAVTAGNLFTCALVDDGGVRCWGKNGEGQLGEGGRTAAMIVRDVKDVSDTSDRLTTALWVSAGAEHACAVLTDRRVACWGENAEGQLGLGAGSVPTDALTPNVVPGVTGAIRVAAGSTHTCAISSDGATVWCWGENGEGEIGDGTTDDSASAVAVTLP